MRMVIFGLMNRGQSIPSAWGPETAWGRRAELRKIGQTFFCPTRGGAIKI